MQQIYNLAAMKKTKNKRRILEAKEIVNPKSKIL